jgi:hypothetical protein
MTSVIVSRASVLSIVRSIAIHPCASAIEQIEIPFIHAWFTHVAISRRFG